MVTILLVVVLCAYKYAVRLKHRGKAWNRARERYERHLNDGDSTAKWVKSPNRPKMPKSQIGRTPKTTRSGKRETKIPRRPVQSSISKMELPKSLSPAAFKRQVTSRKKPDFRNKSHKQHMQNISKKKKAADSRRCRYVETNIKPRMMQYDKQVKKRQGLINMLNNEFPAADVMTKSTDPAKTKPQRDRAFYRLPKFLWNQQRFERNRAKDYQQWFDGGC